ncbi:MAG: virulence factor [Gammaproteobacteria bacterium]|nr:virulence factor [Gammaproteobacteria bacterium]
MADVKVTYWKQIPVSVQVRGEGGDRSGLQLPPVYMETVDGIAMREGATSSTDYMKQFRYEKFTRDGSAKDIAAAVAEELQQKHPVQWLREQRRNAGLDGE